MKTKLLAALALVALVACAAEDPCLPANGIEPICGFLSPEDLEVVPGGEYLVVGGFNIDDDDGDLRVVRLADRSVQRVYPSDADTPPVRDEGWGDPDCPGAPEGFAAHGIALSPYRAGSYALLVVNHTSREAVEWFELTERAGTFAATWRGCTVVDPELWINDVAWLPEGGFVASHMMPREDAGTLFDRPMNDGIETGYLVSWHRDTGWRKLPGSEGALPNGLQVSADGRVVYSNHYLSNQTVAIERRTGRRLWTTPVEGAPDNMSITPSGELLIASHLAPLRAIRECILEAAPYCGLGFALHRIDPETGAATRIFRSEGAPFGGCTAAVESGDSIYMGAFSGNRIGRIDVPR